MIEYELDKGDISTTMDKIWGPHVSSGVRMSIEASWIQLLSILCSCEIILFLIFLPSLNMSLLEIPHVTSNPSLTMIREVEV